ncbi:nucleotidyltransferase domain-containing protein [bacterium]|nr:nucleotidyltransferase domain-containing protein [bacterium]
MSGQKLQIDETLLNEVTRRIREAVGPDRIILFGSAATGDMNRDSDLDLLVLMDSPRNTRQESVRIRSRLRGLGWPIDVLVMDTARFDETKDIIGSVAYPANRYGRVLYALS